MPYSPTSCYMFLQALKRASDRHVRQCVGGSAEPPWLSQWHPHYPTDLSGYRITIHTDCYDFSFLSLHRSSLDSFSCWTNFAPSFKDALCLNPASLALRHAWPASIFLRTSFYFLCNVLYNLLLFYRTDHLPFISVLAFPLQALLGPCAGSPHI